MIDDVEREVAQRFGLGASSGPLVQSFLSLVETDFPGGWEGVLSRFRRQGYGLEVASWLGSGPVAAVEPQSLDEVFGSETISFLSERTGVNEATVTDVIAFVLPTLVRRLKDPSGVGVRPPAWAAGTLATTHRPDLTELETPEPEWRSPFAVEIPEESDAEPAAVEEVFERPVRTREPGGLGGWVTPVALAAVVAMIAIFASRGGSLQNRAVAATEKPATRVLSAAANRQEGRLIPPSLVLRQVGSTWTYSGVVNRDEEKEALVDALTRLEAKGSLDVDPGVDPSFWTPFFAELTREVPRGLQFTFEGRKVTLSGLSDSELTRWAEVLQDRITTDLEVRALNIDRDTEEANKLVDAEITRLETEGVSDPAVVLATLNKQVINFRSGSVSVPATNKLLLERAGRLLAEAPGGTVIGVFGFTDSTGSAGGNLRLSQRRADSVAEILRGSGVPDAVIRAEGKGAENPVASNDTIEGRLKNRRIEFVLNPN